MDSREFDRLLARGLRQRVAEYVRELATPDLPAEKRRELNEKKWTAITQAMQIERELRQKWL